MNINPSNYIIAAVGYVIVFMALFLLYLVFTAIPKLLNMRIRQKMTQLGITKNEQEKIGEDIPGVENAAIATALFLYFDQLHDEESSKITIKRVTKRYSPWNSKIYGLNNFQK